MGMATLPGGTASATLSSVPALDTGRPDGLLTWVGIELAPGGGAAGFLPDLPSSISGSVLVFLRFLSSSLPFPGFLFLLFPISSGASGARNMAGIFTGVPPDTLWLLLTIFLLLVLVSPPLPVTANDTTFTFPGRSSRGFLSGH